MPVHLNLLEEKNICIYEFVKGTLEFMENKLFRNSIYICHM